MKFDFTEQIKQKSDEELAQIFVNAKDFNPEFVSLAEKELKSRNISIDSSLQKKDIAADTDIEQLSRGKPGSPLYILLCFVLAIFGGIIAMYAGYIYAYSKNSDGSGNHFYVYNEETRQLGRIMLWVGAAAFIFIILRQLSAT